MGTPTPQAFAAVDLGATSGRVIRAEVSAQGATLREAHRFANGPYFDGAALRWDIRSLWQEILIGLRRAAEEGPLQGIGIDSWAVDYGLLDGEGHLLADPVAYRDERTKPVIDQVHRKVSPERLYAISGMQFMPFNTIYQLAAEAQGPVLDSARQLLMLPDLLAYWLTGSRVAEVTNASTTALLDQRTRTWSQELIEAMGLDPGLFAPVVEPGDVIGTLTPQVQSQTGLGEVPVYAVGSHDTASAVLAVPADRADFAYISSGTWSLVGVELQEPVLTEDSRQANFTNELGVDRSVRYLRNVMGLWVLSECQRIWAEAGQEQSLPDLLTRAGQLPPRRTLVDVDHPDFLPPGDMPARLAEHARAGGHPVPQDPAEITRCVIDSLALAYRRALADATALSGQEISLVHVVGGGSLNELLCQVTADATGLPVLAGPAEGTALGNALVQARAAGALSGGREGLRAVAARSAAPRRYVPNPAEREAWRAVHPVRAVPSKPASPSNPSQD